MTERNEQQPKAPYPAEKARGGEIILRTPLRRAIFIAGLVGAVVLGLLLAFARFTIELGRASAVPGRQEICMDNRQLTVQADIQP